MRHYLLSIGLLMLAAFAWAETEAPRVDALDDESFWVEAKSDIVLRLTQPETGAEPGFPTRVRWIARPEGLLFHFSNDQDEQRYPRRAPRQQRDNLGGTDRVNVMLDPDGTGQLGYNLTLSRSDSIEDSTISNENLFNPDWDGVWFHAVRERAGGWDAEILLPWSSILMRGTGATRTIGLYLDRVIGFDEQRAASPALIFFRPQFLSLFEKHSVPSYDSSLLRWYPYVSVLSDQVRERIEARAGLDIFWKPGSFQLTAALNPDFGQVEADDLVVNFDAVEVFFSDKRPFFTENQGGFVLQSPEEEPLIYTRRVGANRDDGRGASNIDAAVKVNGSLGGMNVGVFSVLEQDADDVGRTVGALRLQHPGRSGDLGYLGSYVERPFIDRRATVHAVDGEWRPNERWQFSGVLLGSQIEQRGADTDGYGGWGRAIFKRNANQDFFLDLTRYDRVLDFNDLGFQRRRDLMLYEFTTRTRKTDYAEGSLFRSRTLGLEIDAPENTAGRGLGRAVEVSFDYGLADGGFAYAELGARQSRLDDLMSRGNGPIRIPGGVYSFAQYETPRRGNVKWGIEGFYSRDGYKDNQYYFSPSARWFVSDDLALAFVVEATRFENRLLWRQDRLFGRFATTKSLEPRIDFEWFSGNQHEFRAKFQWLAIAGRSAEAFELMDNERLRPSNRVVPDFAINSLGIQLRYRYKINQESDFFAVYSRGGERNEFESTRPGDLLDEALELRDADQFLLKLRYAF